MGIVRSLLTCVISGIVASGTYAFIKKMVRPKIKIVDVALHDSEKDLFIVKIINRTKYRVSDVSYYLQYYQFLPNGYDIKECRPCKSVSPTIEGFVNDKDVSDAPSLYAVQCGFHIPEGVALDEKDKLVFSIRTTHPLSGTVSHDVMEFTFKKDKDVVSGMAFDAGNNMGVHRIGT